MRETVVTLVTAVIAVAVLTAMSLRANRRFRMEPRLPMQWWTDGSVTWTAPRPLALAFMPVVAAVSLVAIATLTIFARPRAGQEHLVIPMNVLVALAFLGVHALHLWLIARTLRRRG
jgi:hypothetical protein